MRFIDRIKGITSKEERRIIPQDERILLLGRHGVAQTLPPQFDEACIKHGKRVVQLGDVNLFEKAFFNRKKDSELESVPSGVVLFETVHYGDFSGRNTRLNSYESGFNLEVEKLCREHDVPLVEIRDQDGMLELNGFNILLESKTPSNKLLRRG